MRNVRLWKLAGLLLIALLLCAFGAGAEEAMEVTFEGLELPTIHTYQTGGSLRGVLTSNVPLTGVSVAVIDDRSLETVLEASQSFEPGADVRTFDLSAFDGKLRFQTLKAGEKTLRITVSSETETREVLSQFFYVADKKSHFTRPVHMTGDCKITVSHGKWGEMTDRNYNTWWKIRNVGDRVQIVVPEDRTAALLTLEWSIAPSPFTVTMLDANGEVLSTITEDNRCEMINFGYEIDPAAKAIQVFPSDQKAGICELRVMEEGKVPNCAQRWQPAGDKVDMMIFSAHQDDEVLLFGGTIPYYAAQGKNVLVVYMANCGRSRYAEALNGLWDCGLRTHPVFVGLKDRLLDSYDAAVRLWGYENTETIVTELLRRYKPDVVVTHDIDGEYGHKQHILTSAVVRSAVERAADPESYPESAEKYGVWQPQKLYIHLYGENELTMNVYDEPMDEFGGFSSSQMATIAYWKHASQQNDFVASLGEVYDNRKFGLYFSTVGEDVAKNDLFENIVP